MSSHETLIRIFEYALNQEKTGMSFFKTSLERMGIGAAADAFRRLIREEEEHIRFISRILQDLQSEEDIRIPQVSDVDLESTDYFDERARTEFLQRCIEGSMVPDVTVFNTAWLIERDLSEFYATMAGKTSGKAREALEMLSRWEKGHERFFREFRDILTKRYSEMPWGG